MRLQQTAKNPGGFTLFFSRSSPDVTADENTRDELSSPDSFQVFLVGSLPASDTFSVVVLSLQRSPSIRFDRSQSFSDSFVSHGETLGDNETVLGMKQLSMGGCFRISLGHRIFLSFIVRNFEDSIRIRKWAFRNLVMPLLGCKVFVKKGKHFVYQT